MTEHQLVDEVIYGEQLFAAGNFVEALEHFNILLGQTPENLRVLNNKGVVLNSMGRYHEATIAFLEVLQRDDMYTNAVFNLISNYIDMYEFREAGKALQAFGQCLEARDIAAIRNLIQQFHGSEPAETSQRTHLNISMDINGTPHIIRLHLDRQQTTQAKMYECFAANQLYEPGIARLFAEVLQAGDCVVDVGAHIGYFTLLAATLVGLHGKVFAFELDADNANQLSANIALNNYAHVLPFQGAVGTANTTVQYFINADDEGGHALWNIGGQLANARSRAQCHTRSVEMMTLDTVLSKHELAAVKLIKISAEGAEYDVILGGIQTLIKYDVPYIVCRLHPFALRQMGQAENELRSFMGSLGYAASLIAPDGFTLQPLAPEQALEEASSVTVVFTKLHPQTDTLPYPRIF